MKPYSAYKDSGVEWIGEIPEHWKVRKLKWLAKVRLSNIDKKSKEEEVPVELCNYVDVYYNEKITPAIEFMKATARKEQIDVLSLEKGDVLITKDSETSDDIAVPAFVPSSLLGVVCGYHLALIRPYHQSAYGNYLFRSFSANGIGEQFEASANGITRFGISKHAIANAVFLAPPVSEQKPIAEYLDRKTQQINALIEKKQKQIDLLKEQRTAIINQAITKGLNPKANMKDSGIEWLGEIPEHWEMKRIKFLTKTISKGTTPSTLGREILEEGDVRFLKAENIVGNRVSMSPTFFIDKETDGLLKRSRLMKSDVLFVIAGATIGKTAIIRNKHLPANTNQAVSFLRPIPSANPPFIYYWLQSSMISETVWLNAVQSAQPNIAMEDLGNLPIPRPPTQEQARIVEFINDKLKVNDAIEDKIRVQIDLFQEYRTALISEVVSGKIDVRNEVLP